MRLSENGEGNEDGSIEVQIGALEEGRQYGIHKGLYASREGTTVQSYHLIFQESSSITGDLPTWPLKEAIRCSREGRDRYRGNAQVVISKSVDKMKCDQTTLSVVVPRPRAVFGSCGQCSMHFPQLHVCCSRHCILEYSQLHANMRQSGYRYSSI